MLPGYLAELGEGTTNRMKAIYSLQIPEESDRTFSLKSTVLVNIHYWGGDVYNIVEM